MASPEDQRESERFPANESSTCTFLSPVLEDFPAAKFKNISTNGVGLIVSQSLSAGLLLAVKLVNPSKKFAKTILVRVAHCTPLAGGTFLVGGTLDAPLTYEELCNFVM